MGRKSKLSEKQWTEIGERLLKGEKGRALAKEFGVAESTIRERFSALHGKVKEVANQVVAAESALKALPVSAQISALNLADELREVSRHMVSAAKFAAASTHRLSSMANQQLDKVNEVDPLESSDLLKTFSVLSKLANEASLIPAGLLNAAANKEVVKSLNDQARPQPKSVTVTVEDASLPDAKT